MGLYSISYIWTPYLKDVSNKKTHFDNNKLIRFMKNVTNNKYNQYKSATFNAIHNTMS